MLTRWRHSGRGLLVPRDILHVADMAGLAGTIDVTLRRHVLEDFATRRAQGLAIPKLSVTLTSAQLGTADLADQFTWDAEGAGVPVNAVTLEILESVMFQVNSAALGTAGFSLSLDDFGTGHAAICRLVHLPISRLKIDRSIVCGGCRDRRLALLSGSMARMAHSLDVEVLAEGIEDASDLDVLPDLGRALFRGFPFGRPMAAPALADRALGRPVARAAPEAGLQTKRTLPI